MQQFNLSAIANAVPGCLRFPRPIHGPMLASLIALLVLFAPSVLAGPHGSCAGADRNEALLVWALETDVEQERVRVKVNRFADPDYRKPFPLESVPVRRSIHTGSPMRGDYYIDNSTRLVQVAPDGTVADTVLNFSHKEMRASMLGSLGAEEQSALLGMGIEPDAVFDVSLPVDRGPTLVSMREETVVLNRLGLPPVAHSFVMFPNHPRHGPHVAGIVGFGDRMVVLDEGGEIIRDIKEPGMSYKDHYLCPAGRFLTYVAATRETREVRVMDIETGNEKRIDLPPGPRYYSADGRYSLVITGAVNQAVYYDVSDPFAPVLLAEYTTEALIETAAVCDDGSLVALLEHEGRLLGSVLLFNRFLEPVGEPLLRSFQVSGGIQFISKFLFAGFQYHPRPAFYSDVNSNCVLAFDLEPGKEGEEGGVPSADGSVWVKPSGIVIADGVWSFLVKTRDLQAASGMGLRIGSTDYSPTLVVETTDSTAVVTFRHEAATSELSAHLRFPGGELAELRVLDGPGHKHERWRKGCISVVSRYGAIRYPPHARERSLDELQGTDESLLVLFRQIGCQSVTKTLYDQSENPSPEDSLMLVERGVPVRSRAIYRNYLILINPEFSERALAFFIGDHPAIEHASVNYMGTQF